jgi:alpha-2-macroglobulin
MITNLRNRNLLPLLASLVFIYFFTGCRQKPKEVIQSDSRFIPYIAAYTSGIISSGSSVKIRLTEPSPAFSGENKPAAEKLFDFSPSITGQAFWIDRQTVEFRPSGPMKQDQVYTGRFSLGKVKQVESSFREFEFGFRTLKQSFELIPEGLVIENNAAPDVYSFEGKLVTMDVVPPDKLKEILSAEYQGKKVEIAWNNEPGNHEFSFRINNLRRDNSSNVLHLSWTGSPIQADISDKLDIPVPATDFFGKLSHRVSIGTEKSLIICFSDPLDPAQDLRGIINTNKDNIVSYHIQGNLLKVFFNDTFDDPFTLNVSGGLLNVSGKKLGQGFEIKEVAGTFASLKPHLRPVGNGTILPGSQGLIFPFEAVNLKSVRLTIIKIYESNIAQFLQENSLEGFGEMNRVGRPVFSKIIPLTNSGVTDFSRWNRFTLDMNDFIKADPGAIYQVNITFRKSNIIYPCTASATDQGTTEDEAMQKLEKRFEGPGYYYFNMEEYNYSDEGFDWHERDNPCNPAYYSGEHMIRRNILATDIGLILKRGNSGDVFVAVTDLRTAAPMSGVSLEVLDYQLQQLVETKSGKDGFAVFHLDRKPFLLIARNGSQRSYLKVDDASSLSLSNFDVSGEEVQKGLKGFIYGERGVWRPGDSLFISFILEDKQSVLPAGHPVIFELKNPKGQLVTRLVQPNDKRKIFTFRTVTADDAMTGKWTAFVKAGGTVFSKLIRIETVKPNRLKINFQLTKNMAFGKAGKIGADLHAQWLHGGTAGNLKATYEVVLTKSMAKFKSLGNYTFDDPGVPFTAETLPVFDGKLDAKGDASIISNLKLNKTLPSALNAFFKGKVFEPGGDFSVDFLTESILPYEHYVGMRVEVPKEGRWLEADKEHHVYLASVDKAGQAVSCDNLRVEITKMQWSWWWEEENDAAAEYRTSAYKHPVSEAKVRTVNGKGDYVFRINYPEWGRFYIKITNLETGQSCGKYVYIDWPYSYGRSDANIPGGATMLALSADRSACKAEEKVKITIPGMPRARALISIENGSKILKAYWVEAGKNENVEEITTTHEMTPNVFIYVTVVQPHQDKKNDLPIRQYGVVALDVEDPGTVLSPQFRMPDLLKPEQKVTLSVSEKNGKPMTYTIAVVDEGLLDLTHFKTPDPHEAFFAHEALGVKTFDLYDQVIGAYGGMLERLLSVGGSEVIKQEEKGKNLRFKPVVRFLGPYVLAAGKTATHQFIMPNYIGSVRTMVIGAGESSYGYAEKTTPVKQDIMVLATMPRVIRPNEEILMPVNVFAMNPAIKNVVVSVKTKNMISVAGASTQTVSFSGEGDKIIYFRLRAGIEPGSGKVDINATGNGTRSDYSVDIPVLTASAPVTTTTDYIVDGGKMKSIDFTPFGYKGTNEVTLEISQVGKVNFSDRIGFLVHYPYGCAEQTTSTAFAQLYLPKVADLPPQMISRTEENVRGGIERIIKLQSADGGFIYWPGSRTIDDWITSYAGHFLLEAMKAGYSVPDYVISKWKEYQRTAAKNWSPDARWKFYQLPQAYRLYTLALAGAPDFSSMNRLKEVPGLLPDVSWRLASAYALAGKQDIARKMTENLPVKTREDYEDYYTYGSELRDMSMILETMTELGQQKAATLLARDLASRVNGKRWLSTQETAYALLSLEKYYTRYSAAEPLNVVITLNGRESRYDTRKYSLNLPLKINESGSNNLQVTSKSAVPLIARLTASGIPVKEDAVSFRKELNMYVSYTGKDGHPVDVTKLKQGTEFKMTIRVIASNVIHGCRNLALTQIFPSGWEIENTRIADTESPADGVPFTYQDFRDDRVYTFFDLYGDKEKVFTFTLTATYAGRFYLPGTSCEAMYNNDIGAKDKGMWVEITRE